MSKKKKKINSAMRKMGAVKYFAYTYDKFYRNRCLPPLLHSKVKQTSVNRHYLIV